MTVPAKMVVTDTEALEMDMNVFAMPAYEVVKLAPETGMETLRALFPDGVANDLNQCLFSTSGTHGSYLSIEDVAASLNTKEPERLTVLVIQPRVVRMLYGDIDIEAADVPFLRGLRNSSRKVLSKL
jgi:hypothetical protein